MIKKILASSILLSSATFSLHTYALQVSGTIEGKTLSKQAHPGFLATQEIPVTLLRVKLSTREIDILRTQQKIMKNINFSSIDLPSRIELNFSKFPVLDQGRHGACVTFAAVTALNYLYDQPDYISSLCSLSLGNTLEQTGYFPSGWEGSFGPMVLDQFMRFGYIKMSDQKNKGACAGVKTYPANNEYDTGKPMTLEQYKQYSHSLLFESTGTNTAMSIYWAPIVTLEERFNLDESTAYDGQKALMRVKQTLAHNTKNIKNIVTIGTLLYGNVCHAGACGKHNTADDTWVMNRTIKEMLNNGTGPDAGHEIAIIGYDDNAIATDQEGITHRGLLTIRNSWSSSAGDHGNYYMSYDYFVALVDEVQKITKVSLSSR